MKKRIEDLLEKLEETMHDHSKKYDFDAVTHLVPLRSRLKELHKRNLELEGEVSEIERALKGINGKATLHSVAALVPQINTTHGREGLRGKPQTLRIIIDWKANKKNHDQEVVCLPTAAGSMVAFFNRLVEEFGDDALTKLRRIRVNRGPLLSKSPSTDFVNRAQGNLYGHSPLGETGDFVLTHSSTPQKVDDLNRISRVIGLVPGSVKVEAIDRSGLYN